MGFFPSSPLFIASAWLPTSAGIPTGAKEKLRQWAAGLAGRRRVEGAQRRNTEVL